MRQLQIFGLRPDGYREPPKLSRLGIRPRFVCYDADLWRARPLAGGGGASLGGW